MLTLAQAKQLSEQRLVGAEDKVKSLVAQIFGISQGLGHKLLVSSFCNSKDLVEVNVLYSDESRMFTDPIYDIMLWPQPYGNNWRNGDRATYISAYASMYVRDAYKALAEACRDDLGVVCGFFDQHAFNPYTFELSPIP